MGTQGTIDHKQEIDRIKDNLAQYEREIAQLRESNLFLETLFNGISEEILVIDQNFLIQDVNTVFLEHHELKKEEVLGEKCHKIAYQSDVPCNFGKQICPLEKVKKTGQRVEVTHYRESKGGKVEELNHIMYPLSSKGKPPTYFMEITWDVTEYQNRISA